MIGWLTSIANYLGNWMVGPWLLLGGVALLAVPIIIHLLNKRKFRTVEWAAIEFLLEANKKNRRRIRIENILLLLLRCLAVLLIALLVARPYRPTTFAGGTLQSVRFERIVVLDDSLSMMAVNDGRSSFDVAKKAIENLVESLRSVKTDESFSLVRLSAPDRPLISGVQLNEDTVTDLIDEIRALEPSDIPIQLETALIEVEKLFRVEPEFVNRVVYVVSDLRYRDWNLSANNANPSVTKNAEGMSAGESQTQDGGTSNGVLNNDALTSNTESADAESLLGRRAALDTLATRAVGFYIVDAGEHAGAAANVSVESVVPQDKVLVAGVNSPFEVTVFNHGPSDVTNAEISFRAGDALPITDRLDRIPAYSSRSVPFSFTFAKAATNSVVASNDSESNSAEPVPIPIRASVSVASQSPTSSNQDQLLEDNTRFFAAQVESGIRTLIVDGDPSASYGKSESFSLQRALAPPGELLSGVTMDVVTDVEFDSVDLANYHVVYLCNLYRLTDQRRTGLESWVRAGGGLVFFLGDQIDEHVYNETLFGDGSGLLPARLTGVLGDESEAKWANFLVNTANHPVLNVFAGENNPFVTWVKVFRWWQVEVDQQQQAKGEVTVTARFSDPQNSPAVIEKQLGDGRVMLVTTPIDRDWSNWPLDASFLIFTQEMTRYVVNKAGLDGTIRVGQSIRYPLDLIRYQLDVSLLDPTQESTPLTAQPDDSMASNSASNPASSPPDETRWVIDYNRVAHRGFYELNLLRTTGQTHTAMFAANIDSTESDLRRVDLAELRQNLRGTSIEVVAADKLTGAAAVGAEGELWPLVLCFAVMALCSEQALGWLFGRNR